MEVERWDQSLLVILKSVSRPEKKEINYGSFKAKGARPLTSAEHTNSSSSGRRETGGKSVRRSTEEGDRESRRSSQQKRFHQHFFSVALFKAKVDKSVLSALHKKKIIKIESQLRSAAPGGGSALRASATVFREEIRKKRKERVTR